MSSFYEDRKTRVLRGYNKAIDMFENMDSVGSRYVYEFDQKRATYSQTENVFYRSVEEVPVFDSPPPAKYYDFIKGISQMRDGGKYPDWTGCDKAQPIRATDFSRPLRAKYEAALAAKWKPDVLYNPSHLTLRMYPEIPVHYTMSQSWHRDMLNDPKLTYFKGDLEGLKCHVSFDTIGQELPPSWTALVPHPQLFKDSYPDGMVEWDGQSIRYTWTTTRVHSVVLTPKDWFYCTTIQTDNILSNNQTKFSAAQAYWLFSSMPFTEKKHKNEEDRKRALNSYRPSYKIPVRIRSDKNVPYYNIKEPEGEQTIGYLDLDQVMEGAHLVPTNEVEVYEDEHTIILEESTHEVKHTTPLIMLYDGQRTGTYISEMGFTMKSVSAYVSEGKVLRPGKLELKGLLAVSENVVLLYEHMLSLYFRHRKKIFTHQIDRVPGIMITIPDTYQYYPLHKLAHYVSQHMGTVTMSQVKAMVRHQGGMIIRTMKEGVRDRYVLEAGFSGVANGREVWSFVHSRRTSFIRVEGVLPRSIRIQIQRAMTINGLLCWYNYVREEFVVSDPHSTSSFNGAYPLKLCEPQSPVYAEYEGEKYYYPHKIAYKEDVQAYYLDLLGQVEIHGIDSLGDLPLETSLDECSIDSSSEWVPEVPAMEYYEFGDSEGSGDQGW
jgi:hypothetical protein